jgi:hypothetical protein
VATVLSGWTLELVTRPVQVAPPSCDRYTLPYVAGRLPSPVPTSTSPARFGFTAMALKYVGSPAGVRSGRPAVDRLHVRPPSCVTCTPPVRAAA